MPIYKKSFFSLLVIAAAIIIGAIYGISTGDEAHEPDKAIANNDQSKNIEDTASEVNSIFVYVTGGVNKPGMVELESDKVLRIADAVEACGGLLPTADTDNINLAETISDGQHIRIPEKAIEQPAQNQSSNSNDTATANDSKNVGGNTVNINMANSEELQTLSGIGSKMAERIIEYRQNNGSFKTIEDIQNVRGIGAKTFEKIKSRIKV